MNQIFEHVGAGGTGVTNFPEEYESFTQLAIDQWCEECLHLKEGDKKPLYIGCQMPSGEGSEVAGLRALRVRKAGEFPPRLAEFWAIHTAHKKAHEAIERIRSMK